MTEQTPDQRPVDPPLHTFFRGSRILGELPVGGTFRINGDLCTLTKREGFTIWYTVCNTSEKCHGDIDYLGRWYTIDEGECTTTVHTDPTVECLNRAFAADPNAMYALINNRVPCNDDLADDPLIVVEPTKVLPAGRYATVGVMGIVNGILTANNLPLVAWRFEPTEDGGKRLVGFCPYTPEPTPSVTVRMFMEGTLDVGGIEERHTTPNWSTFYHHPRIQALVKENPLVKFYVDRRYEDKPLIAMFPDGIKTVGYLDHTDFTELSTWQLPPEAAAPES